MQRLQRVDTLVDKKAEVLLAVAESNTVYSASRGYIRIDRPAIWVVKLDGYLQQPGQCSDSSAAARPEPIAAR